MTYIAGESVQQDKIKTKYIHQHFGHIAVIRWGIRTARPKFKKKTQQIHQHFGHIAVVRWDIRTARPKI